MTKWIVSAPIANSDLSMNFVCYNVDELEDLLAEFPNADVEEVGENSVHYSLEEAKEIIKQIKGATVSPSLTDDQQVVLEWLKQYGEEWGENPLNTVFTMIELYSVDPSYDGAVPLPTKVKEAYKKLNDEQEFQVLAAFAEWGCKSSE